jgi:hypothetical protein
MKNAYSVKPLLHPSEPSRLAIALAGVALFSALVLAVLIHAHETSGLPYLAVFLILIAFLIWFGQQVARARLLGRSVKVTAETVPELQALIDEVRETLQYTRRVDVYLVDKATSPIAMSSYLGTRIIVIEGELVAELLQPECRPQLLFLVGRSIGALKAKLTRLDVVVVLLQSVNALKLVTPLLLPWYRTTNYSGDQIGMVCCADLDAALQATRRLLVGKELAADLGPSAVLPQARLVQRRLLPRFVQLFSSQPHNTNRYANLLCFARYHDPESWERLYASMDSQHIQAFDAIWARSPYRRRLSAFARDRDAAHRMRYGTHGGA